MTKRLMPEDNSAFTLLLRVRYGECDAQQVGNTSYSLRVTLFHHLEKRPVATAEIVYVLVDAKTFSKRPIPDDMRATLLQGAPGVQIDQAGIV